MESLEGVRGTETALSMVTKRGSPQMAGATTKHMRGTRIGAKEHPLGLSNNERNETAHQGRSIYSNQQSEGLHIPSICNAEDFRRRETYSRLACSQQSPESTTLLSAWCQGCSRGHSEQRMDLRPRPSEGLSTGVYGYRGETVPGSTSWRRDSGFSGTPFRVVTQPLCFYKVNQLAGETYPQGDGFKCGCLYRRLLDRRSHERASGERSRNHKGIVQEVRGSSIVEETHRDTATSRVFGIRMGSGQEDSGSNRREEEEISQSSKEFIKKPSDCCQMEDCHWQTPVPTRGHWPNTSTYQFYPIEPRSSINSNEIAVYLVAPFLLSSTPSIYFRAFHLIPTAFFLSPCCGSTPVMLASNALPFISHSAI